MKQNVPPDLYKLVDQLVAGPYYWSPTMHPFFPSTNQEVEYDYPWFVLPDIVHFRVQRAVLKRYSLPQYAASLNEAEGKESLDVLVQVPDLWIASESYEFLIDSLDASGLPLKEVDQELAQKIFVDRMAEFLAVLPSQSSPGPIARDLRAQSAEVPDETTIVNTKRNGDTVIYAKGYFLSTGSAFGTSTPAERRLYPGRYSFGIIENGSPRYEPIVWSCPTTVELDLP